MGFMDYLDCIVGFIIFNKKGIFLNVFDNVFVLGIKYSLKLKFSSMV